MIPMKVFTLRNYAIAYVLNFGMNLFILRDTLSTALLMSLWMAALSLTAIALYQHFDPLPNPERRPGKRAS